MRYLSEIEIQKYKSKVAEEYNGPVQYQKMHLHISEGGYLFVVNAKSGTQKHTDVICTCGITEIIQRN